MDTGDSTPSCTPLLGNWDKGWTCFVQLTQLIEKFFSRVLRGLSGILVSEDGELVALSKDDGQASLDKQENLITSESKVVM